MQLLAQFFELLLFLQTIQECPFGHPSLFLRIQDDFAVLEDGLHQLPLQVRVLLPRDGWLILLEILLLEFVSSLAHLIEFFTLNNFDQLL